MDKLNRKSVLSQCLSLIPFQKIAPVDLFRLDVGKKKLTTVALIKVFIAAQIKGWNSYSEIEEGLRENKELRKELGVFSISGSQLSRRISDVPTELVQDLFTHVVEELHHLSRNSVGISPKIGVLNIVDSTKFKLSPNLCGWAYVSHHWSGVKLHVRVVVANPDAVYPDKVIPSTGNVDDRKGSIELVVESDATYVMDRGYIDYRKMDKWTEDGILYVMRIQA